MEPREGRGIFLGSEIVSIPLFCSLNWPCRSNSPRPGSPLLAQPAPHPRQQPSVPCQGPWPSGLPPQRPPPSSQLQSWVQLCFAPQWEPFALPRDPSFRPLLALPGSPGLTSQQSPSHGYPCPPPALTPLPEMPSSLHPAGECLLQPRVQSRKSWANARAAAFSVYTRDSTNATLAHGPSICTLPLWCLGLILGSPPFPILTYGSKLKNPKICPIILAPAPWCSHPPNSRPIAM